MNNMELTRSVELLNTQVADLNNRLSLAVPGLFQRIADSANNTKTMFDDITADIKP